MNVEGAKSVLDLYADIVAEFRRLTAERNDARTERDAAVAEVELLKRELGWDGL